MLFMVIEHFKEGAVKKVYQRFGEKGRMMPADVTYVNSWVDIISNRCFQVMECPDRSALDAWISNWQDLCDFEVIPVVTSKEAKEHFLGSA